MPFSPPVRLTTVAFATVFLAACAELVQQSRGEELVFTPVALPFGDLDSARVAREVLGRDGILAISDIPGFAAVREEALKAIGECVIKNGHKAAPVNLQLQDGSMRSSWGAFVNHKYAHDPIPKTEFCPGLEQRMEKLRLLVDQGAEYFTQLLDTTMRVEDVDMRLMRRIQGGQYDTFEELLGLAKHLDHFHVYEKHADKHLDDVQTLDLHTDHGLFIAIVPSIRISSKGIQNDEESFKIQLATGEVASVKAPFEGNALLFMLGDGINYLSRASLHPMRAVPHMVSLEPFLEKTVRAWFGRMFFAPEDALLSPRGETFGSIIKNVVEARNVGQDVLTLGCSVASVNGDMEINAYRSLVDPTGHNCSAGSIYCWMVCRSTANLTCPESDMICQSANTGLIWEDCPTCHDMSARLVCRTDSPTHSPTFPTFSPSSAPSTAPVITQQPTASPRFPASSSNSFQTFLHGFAKLSFRFALTMVMSC